MNRSPSTEGVMDHATFGAGGPTPSHGRNRGTSPGTGVGGGGGGSSNAARKSNLAGGSSFNESSLKKGNINQQQQHLYVRDSDIHGFDISQRGLGLGGSAHGASSLLGTGSAHGTAYRRGMMQGGYGMRSAGSHSDFGALSPHVSGPSMLTGNYMNDIAISPTHLGHRMSLGYPNLGGTGSPSLSAGMDNSLRSTGGPMTAEEQAQAEREEELLLSLLIARRQRGRNLGPDGSLMNQPSLSDELVRLKQNHGMADISLRGGLGGDLGMSSQGASLRMNRGLATGSHRLSGMQPFLDGPVGDFQTGNYPMSDYHQVSRYGGGMMQHSQSRIHSQHSSSGYPQNPQVYAQMSGTSKGHFHPSMSHSRGGSRIPTAQQMQAQQFGQHQMQMHDDISERIVRTPQRLLMDARSANQQSMAEFSDRGMKRPLVGGYVGGPNTYESLNLNHQANLEIQGVEIPKPKTKRQHKKKPADMPRRPLSAYNLFFSEERERILKEIEGKDGDNKDGTKKDNDGNSDAEQGESSNDDDASRKDGSKPKALMRPLIPAQKKRRPHRKTHGKISFQQLARMVGERWKNLPDDQRKYYQDLAQEDMKRQKLAMEEYYAKQNASKLTENSGSSPKSQEDTDTDPKQAGIKKSTISSSTSPAKKVKMSPAEHGSESDSIRQKHQTAAVGEDPIEL